MTNFDNTTDEPSDLDLLASSIVDNESTAAGSVAAADPAVSARVARFTSLHNEMAAVGAPPVGALDSIFATALAAYDERSDAPLSDDAASQGDAVTPPPLISLATRRRARWLMPVASAAAALVAVVGVGALLVSLSNSGGDDSSTSQLAIEVANSAPLEAATAADARATDAAAATAGADEATEAEAAKVVAGGAMVGPVQLDPVADPEEGLAAARDALDNLPTDPTSPAFDGSGSVRPTCALPLLTPRATISPAATSESLVLVGLGTLVDGSPIEVYLVDDRLVVVDGACTVLAEERP